MRVQTGQHLQWIGPAMAVALVVARPTAAASPMAADFVPDQASVVESGGNGGSTVLVAIVALAAVATSGGKRRS